MAKTKAATASYKPATVSAGDSFGTACFGFVVENAKGYGDRLFYADQRICLNAGADQARWGCMRLSDFRYTMLLALLFLGVWIASASAPLFPADWLLENALVFVFVAALAVSWRWFVFSRVSMTLIFLFLCLHEIGAHYTYSHVPYDDWFRSLTGHSVSEVMGWKRNHFDRAIHFAYGLLLAYPIREVFLRIANVRGFCGYFLPLSLTMSSSMAFELIEWGAAELFGGDLGIAYLGTQGDVWDTHKDMALATLGALLAMLITAGINGHLQADFVRKGVKNLRMKRRDS